MKQHRYKRRKFRTKQPGFTLLEVILALALSFLVLLGVAMAIDLHLRMLDKRQNEIEQSQLSRSVLQIIREDIRGAVQYTPYDTSALEQVIAGLDPLAADAAAAAVGGDLSGLAGGGGDTGGGLPSMGTDESAGQSSSASRDAATSVAPPTRPGVYGNETALMIDVSRLPRRDQLLYSQSLGGAVLLPSDIKTVAYYVGSKATTAGTGAPSTSYASTGLVRREVDRAVTRYAIDGGGGADLAAAENVIAPEIAAIYFQYFDGTDWQTSWDSDELGRLPVAIEVTVQICGAETGTNVSAASNLQKSVPETHKIVVYLPISEAPTEADEEADTETEESTSEEQSDSAEQ